MEGNLRTPHPLGVYPLGNSLLDPGARVRRISGLGRFARLGDETLLAILHFLPAPACAKLSGTSVILHAFGGSEELWLSYCMRFLEAGGHISWSEHGTWRATYVCSQSCTKSSEPSAAPPQACKRVAARVYSDVLYRGYFYAAVDLDEKWFARDNIKRVDARNLSAAEFVRCYERQSCPVLLEGAAAAWPAMQTWSRSSLLERFGETPFTVGPCDLPLREYYAYASRNLDDAPLFVFDKKFSLRAPALLQDYEVPAVFKDRDLFDLLGDSRPAFRWLLIGNRRSGSKWHVDPNKTSAWNAVVRGRKHWFMLPPGCPPPGVHSSPDGADVTQPVSLIEWFFNFYDELRRLADANAAWDLKEGTCGPGDAIFVPCGWWHCVINLDDDTIAVTQNYASETHVHSVRRFLSERRDQVSGMSLTARRGHASQSASTRRLPARAQNCSQPSQQLQTQQQR